MASVLFLARPENYENLTAFYGRFISEEGKAEMARLGVGRKDGSGVFVGDILKSPPGSMKHEASFLILTIDEFGENLKNFSGDFYSHYGFEGLKMF